MIAADTTVGQLLDEHPELIEVLARFHPHFKQLRHRLLRRVMAPRVTLAQAARMAGVSSEALLAAVREAVGEPERVGAIPPTPSAPTAPAPTTPAPTGPPPELAALRSVEIDVREDIRQGIEPFARIMAAVKALAEGEALLLRAPFEPIPLYNVLGTRGLAHWATARGPDDWRVWFYRAGTPSSPAPARAATIAAPSSTIVVDVRGLEPPQPMVVVLGKLDQLAPDEELLVIHERRPLFLYPQLDQRGFTHETREATPGRVEILIRHGGAAGAGP